MTTRLQRRHLLRLWLAAHRFTSLEQELRQGIRTDPLIPTAARSASSRLDVDAHATRPGVGW